MRSPTGKTRLTVFFVFLALAILVANLALAVQSVNVSKTIITPNPTNVSFNVSYHINVTNNGTENISEGNLVDEFNTTLLNYTTFAILHGDIGDILLGELVNGTLEWVFNLTINDSMLVEVNFTTLMTGNATNIAMAENSSNDLLGDGAAPFLEIFPPAGMGGMVNISVEKTTSTPSVVDTGTAVFLINITNRASDQDTLELIDYYNQNELIYDGSAVLAGSEVGAADTSSGGEVVWEFNISNGASVIIQVNFTANSSGTTRNNATVENSSLDQLASSAIDITRTPAGAYTPLWNQAQQSQLFSSAQMSNFDLLSVPYVVRGPGCGFSDFTDYSTASAGDQCCINQNCNATSNYQYDLGAVWVDQYSDYIAWHIEGPFITEENMSVCDGVDKEAAYVVEFDIDDNMSTGCSINNGTEEGCYPGSDFQLWFFPDDNTTLFSYYNGSNNNTRGSTPGAYTGHESLVFAANTSASANDMWVYYNCSGGTSGVDTGLTIIVNKSAFNVSFSSIKLNFETNSFNQTFQSAPPIDQLTNFVNGQALDNFIFTGPGPDEGACFQFDDNQSSCTNATDDYKCIWKDFGGGKGLCDPDFNSFAVGTSCFQYGTNATCLGDADNIGYCHWEDDVTLPNGSTGLCVEEFDPFEFSGGDCDSDCFNCFSETQCTNSDANGGSTYGGCGWYNDTFNPAGWCDVKNLKFGCSETPRDCFTQGECEPTWHWNATWGVCVKQAGDEICFNGVDDNGDSAVDCADSTCEDSKYCGGFIDTLTGDYAGLSSEDALLMKLGAGMGDVIVLGNDVVDAANESVEALGFGIGVSPLGLGIGIMMQNLSDLSACGGSIDDRKFIYVIDTDANASSGCNVTVDGTDYVGFEYLIKSGNYSVVNESSQEKMFYACYQDTWVLRDSIVISPPGDDMGQSTGLPMECAGDGQDGGPSFGMPAVIMIEKADIGNPKNDMRFMGVVVNGSWNNVSDLESYDIIPELYYTPGTIDFEPVDCFEEPTKCGAEFMILGGGEFIPFEDCFSPGDEDGDGAENCADTDCNFAPQCQGQTTYNASADKTRPKVKSETVDEFDDFAVVRWTTNEPTKGNISFYGNDSSCSQLNATLFDDGLPSVTFDDVRPWHDMPLDVPTLGFSLNPGTTYYYKIKNLDQANNTALSACLNFTTASGPENVSVFFNYTPDVGNEEDFLGNLQIIVNNQPFQVGAAEQKEPATLQNANVTFKNPNASAANNWSVTLVGVDLTKAMSIDFDDAFVANRSQGDPFIGMETGDWNNIVQKMGADYLLLRIPEGDDTLDKCDDSGENCVDVTNTGGVNKTAGGSDWSEWRVPASLGFSSYSGGAITYILNFTNETGGAVATATAQINISTNVIIFSNNTMNSTQTYNFSLELPATVTGLINGSATLDDVSLTSNQTAVLNLSLNGTTAGAYTVGVIARLSSNASIFLNSSDDMTITFTVTQSPDVTDPVAWLVTPVADYNSTGSVTFTCNATDNRNLSYINLTVYDASGNVNITNTSAKTGTSATASFTHTFASDGLYNWTCLAGDVAGNNITNSTNRTFRIDGTGPMTTSNASSFGPWNDTAFNVTLNATDAGIGVATIFYSLDSAAYTNGSVVEITTSGNHSIAHYANDTLGNNGSVTTEYVYLDITAPVVNITTHTTGGTALVNLSINGTVTEAHSGVDYVEITINGSVVGNATVSGSSSPYSWNYTHVASAGVVLNITANAYDNVGLNHTDTITGVTVDATAPNITASGPSGEQSSTSVTLSATTNEAATCKYDASDVAYASMTGDFTGSGTAHTKSLTGTAGQSYTYYARCADTAGNAMNTSTTISYSIASAGSSSGGGGGSISSGQYLSRTAQRISLSTYGSFFFQVAGDTVRHSIRIRSAGIDSVTFTVASTPQDVTVNVGESVDVDVTGDGKPDLVIELAEITPNGANILVSRYDKEIEPLVDTKETTVEEESEPEPEVSEEPLETAEAEVLEEVAVVEDTGEETPEETDEGGFAWWLWAIVVALLAVILFFAFRKPKEPELDYKSKLDEVHKHMDRLEKEHHPRHKNADPYKINK